MSYYFGQFTPEHLKKMEEGVKLFNQQKYWESHESLEDVWMEDRNDNARNVYWAVIQVAAACIHYRDKNLVGARGMLFKAKEKFRRIRTLPIYTPLLDQYLDWTELESLVMGISEEAGLESYANLFEFRFMHYSASVS